MSHSPISALFTDRYQITMMYAHWKNESYLNHCAFELYFRSLPFKSGYAVFAGLERAIEYIDTLRFTEDDVSYLQSIDPNLDPKFLDMLQSFQFSGDMYAMREGTIVFPNEPLLRVEGTMMELQLIETALLNFIGYQTLVATKAARIRHVCGNDTLMEFGTRRAQEMDAALWGARATYIGGFNSTSNLLAGKRFGIPTTGTQSHSWVQDFPREVEAFRTYAKAIPYNIVFLVDTYDTLLSGLPHAIQVGLELKKQGLHLSAIRLDSGNLAYLSKRARSMLDAAGLNNTQIIASSDLDEQTILNLKSQDAKIDAWGVGTRLITSYDQPALGAVYKMVAKKKEDNWLPTVKLSSTPGKATIPGRKKVYRITNTIQNKAHGDIIMDVEEQHPLEAFREERFMYQDTSYKCSEITAIPLMNCILQQGILQYSLPNLEQIRSYHNSQLTLFQEEHLRILVPETYPVDFSRKLQDTKQKLTNKLLISFT